MCFLIFPHAQLSEAREEVERLKMEAAIVQESWDQDRLALQEQVYVSTPIAVYCLSLLLTFPLVSWLMSVAMS